MNFPREYKIQIDGMLSIDLNVELVRSLISAQFPQWSGLPVVPVIPGGWDNRTFRLGQRMIVRLPSARDYVSQVEREHRWLPQIAPSLPLPIPAPLAMGKPTEIYPWNWSVYSWLAGENANRGPIPSLCVFADDLAQFLVALRQISAASGPPPGRHNFYRGGDLAVYDDETRQAISILKDRINDEAAIGMWEAALATTWCNEPAWVHGDVSPGNLLVCNGRLSAVIDFGNLAAGDPACDFAIAWTFFRGESRHRFHRAVFIDEATWKRSRGWALWKSLITYAQLPGTDPRAVKDSERILSEILNEP